MRIKLTPSDDDDVGVVAEQSWLTGSERQQRVNTQQGPPWPCASCKKKPAVKPRLTRCLHVVCYECLELHVRGGDGALICPECGAVGTAEDARKGFQPPESLPRIPQVTPAENTGGSAKLARPGADGREYTAYDGSDLGGRSTAWTGAGMVDEDSGTGSSRAGTEVHHSSNEDVAGDSECSLCDEPTGTAHWYCTDCSPAVYLCRAHRNSHAQAGRRTAGHTVTPIHRATGDLVTVTLYPGSADLEVHSELGAEQLQAYATEDAVSEAEERNCTLHRTRALSSVCLTCNVLLCELCNATSDHARHDHSVLSLAQAAEARRRGMTSSIFRTVSSDDSMALLDGSMASSSSSSRGAGDSIMNTGNGRLSTERRGLCVPDTEEILTRLLVQNCTETEQVKENVSAVRQQTSQFYQRLLEAVQRRQRQTEDTVEDFMRAELSKLEGQRQEIVYGVAAARRVASIADAMVSAAAHDADFLTASPWLKQAVEAGHGKVRALEKRGVRPRTLGFVSDHDITQHVLTSGILAAVRVDKRAAHDPMSSASATGNFPTPSPRSGQRGGSGSVHRKAAPQPAELLAAECTVSPSNSSNSSGGGDGSSIGEEGSDFRRVSCSLSTGDRDVQITLSLSMRSDIDTLLEGSIAPLDPNAISLDVVELSGRTTRLSAAQLSPVRLQSSAPPPRQSKFDFRAEYTAGGAAAFAETKATGASPGNNPCSFAKLAESSADTTRGSTAAKGSANGKGLDTATGKAQPLSIPLMSQADRVSTTLSPAKHSVSTTFPSPSTRPSIATVTSASPGRRDVCLTPIGRGATAVTKTTPATSPAVAKTTPTSATAAAAAAAIPAATATAAATEITAAAAAAAAAKAAATVATKAAAKPAAKAAAPAATAKAAPAKAKRAAVASAAPAAAHSASRAPPVTTLAASAFTTAGSATSSRTVTKTTTPLQATSSHVTMATTAKSTAPVAVANPGTLLTMAAKPSPSTSALESNASSSIGGLKPPGLGGDKQKETKQKVLQKAGVRSGKKSPAAATSAVALGNSPCLRQLHIHYWDTQPTHCAVTSDNMTSSTGDGRRNDLLFVALDAVRITFTPPRIGVFDIRVQYNGSAIARCGQAKILAYRVPAFRFEPMLSQALLPDSAGWESMNNGTTAVGHVDPPDLANVFCGMVGYADKSTWALRLHWPSRGAARESAAAALGVGCVEAGIVRASLLPGNVLQTQMSDRPQKTKEFLFTIDQPVADGCFGYDGEDMGRDHSVGPGGGSRGSSIFAIARTGIHGRLPVLKWAMEAPPLFQPASTPSSKGATPTAATTSVAAAVKAAAATPATPPEATPASSPGVQSSSLTASAMSPTPVPRSMPFGQPSEFQPHLSSPLSSPPSSKGLQHTPTASASASRLKATPSSLSPVSCYRGSAGIISPASFSPVSSGRASGIASPEHSSPVSSDKPSKWKASPAGSSPVWWLKETAAAGMASPTSPITLSGVSTASPVLKSPPRPLSPSGTASIPPSSPGTNASSALSSPSPPPPTLSSSGTASIPPSSTGPNAASSPSRTGEVTSPVCGLLIFTVDCKRSLLTVYDEASADEHSIQLPSDLGWWRPAVRLPNGVAASIVG